MPMQTPAKLEDFTSSSGFSEESSWYSIKPESPGELLWKENVLNCQRTGAGPLLPRWPEILLQPLQMNEEVSTT